jgi:hypothetical protein
MAPLSENESVGKSSRRLARANAIERLKSLHGGDEAFAGLLVFGAEAVPELRTLLFERESSGLYQPRRLAAEALAALKSFDTLGEFLRLDREIDDPVERLGEEVVISTAARAIAQLREEWVFQLLLGLAKRHRLSGVLTGVGAFKRRESIPCLVRALASAGDPRLCRGGSSSLTFPGVHRRSSNVSSHSHERNFTDGRL